jgi:protein-disulfide isomerase/uncharacterized membrane protein
MSEAKRRTRALVALSFLALLAAIDGVYLTFVHVDYEFGRPGLNAFCHAFSARGCSVTAGRFGDLFGVPVSVIGFAGAVTIIAVSVLAATRRQRAIDPARSVLFLLTGASVAASVLMAALSAVERSFCPFCLLWYVLNAGMFAAAWSLRDPMGESLRDTVDDALGGAGMLAVVTFCVSAVLGLWLHEHQRSIVAEEFERLKVAWVNDFVGSDPVELGQLADAPRKGPDDADLVIVEFSDFECPFCMKLWTTIEEYVESTDHRVQVVFAHYPLDAKCNASAQTIHPNACDAAMAAHCAHRQDRFWPYAQLLFDNQGDFEREQLVRYAEEIGIDTGTFETCLDDPSTLDRIRVDVERGRALGVEATPTFFLDGHMHKGGTHPSLFGAAADRLASDSKQ